MKLLNNLIIKDNFLDDPDAIRKEGINANYIDWVGADKIVYKRICIGTIPSVLTALEDIVGKVNLLGMAYRLNYEDELPNCSIHTDVGWGTHAMVLYLTDGDSGTAFWTHKETGKVGMEPGDIETLVKIKNDTEDSSKWELSKLVPMKYNRAAIYSSELFHSRFPFKAFGKTPEDGRLTVVAFFTPEKKIGELYG